MQIKEEAQPVKVGDAVVVVDEQRVMHVGLVTVVHGEFGAGYTPCINVVYVSADASKRDRYGQQVERLSSLQHYAAGPSQMPNPGRFWSNL